MDRACKLHELQVHFQIPTGKKKGLYCTCYTAPYRYLYMAHILKILMLVLKNLLKLSEVDPSGEVACVSRHSALSLLNHLGHKGALSACPQEEQPCPRGTVCYKASQISSSSAAE